MSHKRLVMAAIAVSLGAAGMGAAFGAEQTLNPKAISIKLPEQIPWKLNAAAGNETAVVYGDPDKPGPYVMFYKSAAGPHEPAALASQRSHDHGAQGNVVGRHRRSIRARDDVPIPTGSYVTHFGKEVHYDGAKGEEVWLLMAGEGPATSTPAATPPPAH